MSIWNHECLNHPFSHGYDAKLLESTTCLYCKMQLTIVNPTPQHGEAHCRANVGCCPVCGWWYVEEREYRVNHDFFYGGFASLKELDITQKDIALPLEEIRAYLLAKYDSRFSIHPRIFEETVAAVFKDLGYQTRVTAYHRDNGIDVYLDGPGNTLTGIQVKRRRDSIKIEQIHSLCGALIVNQCTRGIFVTTSQFQKGATKNANTFGEITGIPIELVDATAFYDALCISSRQAIWDQNDPDAPWNRVKWKDLYSE